MIEGVTEIVAVIGSFPLFTATNDGRFPVPDAGNPIDVLEFVQLSVASGVATKLYPGNTAPSFTVVFETIVTAGTGFTSYVNDVVSAHWPDEGVNMYFAVVVLSTTGTFQVPVTPFVEVPGNTGAGNPTHTDWKVPKLNSGLTILLMVTVNVIGVTHWPGPALNT